MANYISTNKNEIKNKSIQEKSMNRINKLKNHVTEDLS